MSVRTYMLLFAVILLIPTGIALIGDWQIRRQK
jgi:hypothetical protein